MLSSSYVKRYWRNKYKWTENKIRLLFNLGKILNKKQKNFLIYSKYEIYYCESLASLDLIEAIDHNFLKLDAYLIEIDQFPLKKKKSQSIWNR